MSDDGRGRRGMSWPDVAALLVVAGFVLGLLWLVLSLFR